jgi:hypothetical protein
MSIDLRFKDSGQLDEACIHALSVEFRHLDGCTVTLDVFGRDGDDRRRIAVVFVPECEVLAACASYLSDDAKRRKGSEDNG